MSRYKDELNLVKLGANLTKQREALELSVEDVSEMTGFSAQTIRNIEAGEESSLSYVIAICQALELHPTQAFDFPIKLEPRYKLSAVRAEKTRLTQRIEGFVAGDYFNEGRTAKDVVTELNEVYHIQTTTSAVSVILKRKVNEQLLKIDQAGKQRMYKKNSWFLADCIILSAA